MEVILASNSPRRRDLLEQAGVTFTVLAAETDESLSDGLRAEPARAARELAKRKAGAVVQQLLAGDLAPAEGAPAREIAVVGADTMVVLDGRIFGKPHSASEATGMLRKLSGRTHEVVTGVALEVLQVDAAGQVSMGHAAFSETSEVTFRELSDGEIAAYLRKGESYDKAGAYAIQGEGAALVERYEGAFDNIVGLPVATLLASFPQLRGE